MVNQKVDLLLYYLPKAYPSHNNLESDLFKNSEERKYFVLKLLLLEGFFVCLFWLEGFCLGWGREFGVCLFCLRFQHIFGSVYSYCFNRSSVWKKLHVCFTLDLFNFSSCIFLLV